MTQQALDQPCQPEWSLFTDSGVPVSNFTPSVTNLVEMIDPTDTSNKVEAAKVVLDFKDGSSTEVVIQLSGLENVNWSAKDRRCIINPEYRQAKRYIASIIRAGLSSVPLDTRYLLNRTGIHHFNNAVVFAAGDRVITRSSAPESSPAFELGQLPFRLDIDENISPRDAIEGILELISLSPESGAVLVAHVISGIIRAAFKEAGITPCAVLIVVGKSGMLKSHYVPHLVQLYNRADGVGPVTRFNSTKRFIEDALYDYSECTAVIDDLHTAESRGIKRRNEDTAEEIIRRISDDAGRGRMDGNTQVQRHFRGNVVFIGEYTIGKASTVPRVLVVDLTKPPNGKILDHYQRHQPLLVSTFYYYFIQWYVDHFDEIRDAIDARLTKLREATASSTTHGRLRDTQFYLQISFMLFLEFCKDSGFCSDEDTKDTYNRFHSQLQTLVQAQEARYKESVEEKATDYLALIRRLYAQGSFRVAKNVKDFDPDKHDGLIYYECLCLRGKRLAKKIKRICSSFNLDDCIDSLLAKNALKLVGHKNTVQISGTDGKRFYAIWLKNLTGRL